MSYKLPQIHSCLPHPRLVHSQNAHGYEDYLVIVCLRFPFNETNLLESLRQRMEQVTPIPALRTHRAWQGYSPAFRRSQTGTQHQHQHLTQSTLLPCWQSWHRHAFGTTQLPRHSSSSSQALARTPLSSTLQRRPSWHQGFHHLSAAAGHRSEGCGSGRDPSLL